MLKRKSFLMICIVLCMICPIFGKPNSPKSQGFKEISKEKYNTDTIHTYRHVATGLEVIWIENEDVNKSFVLGVKTPTTDSTGVNHIIEHTLFTGSKDYPSASLFFDASEAYPNTYMNALTSGDMTLFPFSTPYLSCYKELMHIYLDAVFKPNLLKEPYGFYEEAFYSSPMENRVGGVVYNEMKGAYSSKERTVFRSLRNMIFKDSHYAYDSGGSPNEIPTLTYENCLKVYKKYYYPANMKIVLYGAIPLEESLQMITSYLTDLTKPKESIDLSVQMLNPEKTATYTVLPSGDKGVLVKSFVLEKSLSPEKIQALDLWMTAYLMSPQTGFWQNLNRIGLGKARWIKDEDLPCPVYSLVISDLPTNQLENCARQLDQLIASMPKDLGMNNFTEQDVLAQANWLVLKEDTSVNRGIDIAQSMLEAWAHYKTINQYYEKKEYIQNAKSLDADSRQILFEQATRYTLLLLPGSYELKEPEKLSPVSDEEWLDIVPKMEAWQKQKTKLEAVDLRELILKPHIEIKSKQKKNYTEMVTEVESTWARSQLYFNTAHIPQKELPYLFLYAHLLEESAKEITPFSGIITTGCTAYPSEKGYWPCFKLAVLTKAEETDHSTLLREARLHLQNKPDEWYRQKLIEWVMDMKEASENNVIGTLSHLSLGAEEGLKRYLYEQSYPTYTFCEELLKMHHTAWRLNVERIDKKLYHTGDLIVATTIPAKESNLYAKSWEDFLETLPCLEHKTATYKFVATSKNCVVTSHAAIDHSYIGMDKGIPLDGLDYLATTYLTKNYLNPRIRVGLGAYGAGCQLSYPYTISFYTYRDPNIERSLPILEKAHEFLSTNVDSIALESSKAEALSRLHSQFRLLGTPLEEANALEGLVLWGQGPADLMRLQEEILKATPEAVKAKGAIYKELFKQGRVSIMTQKSYTTEKEFTTYSY